MTHGTACGDEKCGVCQHHFKDGEETFYNANDNVLFCSPCIDMAEDLMIGKVDTEDSRFNYEYFF